MFFMTTNSINELDKLDCNIIHEPSVGGIVYFQGVVRNHNEGKKVESLEYESYYSMAIKVGHQIIEEAKKKFDIVDAFCIHRTGHLQINDTAVWVITTSHHREAAYKASQYIIDVVKTTVPIWKKEHYVDESAQWVACHQCLEHGHKHHHGHN